MSGSSKRRNSKWEHIDSEAFPESFYDRAPPRRPREPLSPGRGSHRHGSRSKESTMTWDREGKCSRMSPELDERRPRHSSRSPRNGWGRSHRISKSRSRSRSRSPAHNFRREPAGNDRSRSRSGGSAQICRDFASGRCRRGSSCHFLHQDAQVYDNRRLECSPPDDWESRRGRSGGSRYSPDDTKNIAVRTEKSAHICNDFLKGRCRRADCRYVHPDTAADVFVKGPVEDVYRNRDHESRSKDTYPDHDRRRRDTYPDRNHEFEPPKRGETPCKFFAAGNCRNGTRCRFSHQVQETFSPDRRSLDDRRGPDPKFECSQGWDGPRWSDVTTVSSIPDLQGWGDEKTENKEVNTVRTMGDGRGTSYSDVTIVSTVPDMKGWEENKIESKEMSTVRNQSDGRAAGHIYESDRVWDAPSWSDTTIVPNVSVHGWGEEINETTEVAKEVTRSRPGDDSWNHNMLDINQTWDTQATIDKSQIQDSKQLLQWKMETVVPGMGLPASRGIENISGDMEISPMDIKQQGVNSSTTHAPSTSNIVFPAVQQEAPGEVSYEKHFQAGFQEHNFFTDPFTEQNPSDKDNKPISFAVERGDGVGIRDGPSIIQIPPVQFSQEQSIFQPSHIVSAHPISNINPAGQNQLSLPSHPSRGETLPLSHNSSSFQDNRVADGSHVVSLAPSVLAAGSATAPNTVSSVQLAQLSHLTASLTQLLENRQQLSHFSSAVTPQSMSKLPDLTAPIPPVSAPMSQPNEAPVVSKQYNPVFSSIEPKMHNLGNHLLPSVDQKTSYNEMHHEGGNVNQQEPLASNKDEESGQKAAEAKIKVPDNRPSKDIGPDDGADDAKKLKDTKGIRPFKFALAEFVKELLKPAWKDGQVDKEAYKTIVKKVVDKVVETLGLQIPQTKEKIDLYLSCSKPKIEKLVQAYVGKHQKS